MGLLTDLLGDGNATSEVGWSAPTGAVGQSYDRNIGTPDIASSLSSGRLQLVAVHLAAGAQVTSISFFSGSTALSDGTNQWFALYDASRNKLAVTADDTSTAWGVNTIKTLSLASPYTITTSGIYYLGACVVATTVPDLRGRSTNSVSNALAPTLAGHSTSGLTNPASAPATAAAIAAHSLIPWVYAS